MEEFANQNPRPIGGPQWKQLNRQRRVYLMPDFCRISLPIRNPGPDTAEWVRVNGSRTYVLHPQTVTTPGKGVTHIWPYGKKARLLMVWISTQVVRQKKHNTSRVIMLPSTLRQLMEDLGIQRKPRKTDYEDFKRQISALSYFDMTITETKTTTETVWQDTKKVTLVEESHIGWSRYTPKNGITEGSYIQLTQETWNRMAKSTPLSADMVEILTSTGRGAEFDIYAWLSQRIYALNHSHTYQTPLITWKSLQNQMGSNYAETRNFVTRFKQSLNHVAALWNAALTDADAEGRLHYSIKKGGLRLYRSPVSVVPKPKRPDHADTLHQEADPLPQKKDSKSTAEAETFPPVQSYDAPIMLPISTNEDWDHIPIEPIEFEQK